MERAKNIIKDIKLIVSEAVMGEDSVVTLPELKRIYNALKVVEADIQQSEQLRGSIQIPSLPAGDDFNPYPRLLFAYIGEYYSQGKSFTVGEMAEKLGCTRSQIYNDISRLEDANFIVIENVTSGTRGKKLYKIKPYNL